MRVIHAELDTRIESDRIGQFHSSYCFMMSDLIK